MKERQRYLFIRILEASNADCFMGEFALSRDTFRFSPTDFAELPPRAGDGPRGPRAAARYRGDVAGLGAVPPWQY
ncbi:hypothetical protein [Streptomyces celluloflavus]|uniref:hypothetical protein n=1 Tax=Streptomyces celluloflavus TaxID=58344 RepID=UPI00346179E9|nr:hypothetical protein OG717_25165 [Streptomyces celluloflavus]